MKSKKILLPILLICFCGLLAFASIKVYAASNIKINTTSPLLLDGQKIDACSDVGILKGIRILGYLIVVAKIFVPLIIIITGITALLKAVMESDEGAIKKAVSLFITKLMVGAFVFFVPSIVTAAMHLVNGYDSLSWSFSKCGKCLLQVKDCTRIINYGGYDVSSKDNSNCYWVKANGTKERVCDQ